MSDPKKAWVIEAPLRDATSAAFLWICTMQKAMAGIMPVIANFLEATLGMVHVQTMREAN